MNPILILEDNDERIAAFKKTVATLGPDFELKVWRDVSSMCAECEEYFPTAALISLDYDPDPRPLATGLELVKFLAECRPVCPVVIHSANSDRAQSMHNELRFADWVAECVVPVGTNWVQKVWLSKVRELTAKHPNTC